MNIDLRHVPYPKRKKNKVEDLCIALKKNGERCNFVQLQGSLYCGHHKTKSDECNKPVMMESCTNTEGTIIDITTANKLILELIDDKIEREQAMTELLELYKIVRTELEELQTIIS